MGGPVTLTCQVLTLPTQYRLSPRQTNRKPAAFWPHPYCHLRKHRHDMIWWSRDHRPCNPGRLSGTG